jgi:hypothetical protein
MRAPPPRRSRPSSCPIGCARHLFEEPGALERVAELKPDWFLAHLAATG